MCGKLASERAPYRFAFSHLIDDGELMIMIYKHHTALELDISIYALRQCDVCRAAELYYLLYHTHIPFVY